MSFNELFKLPASQLMSDDTLVHNGRDMTITDTDITGDFIRVQLRDAFDMPHLAYFELTDTVTIKI